MHENNKIGLVNEGLRLLQQDLQTDDKARRSVEIAIVAFGHSGVSIAQDFVSANDWQPPVLEAGGSTPMGQAILTALDLVKARKQIYRTNGVRYYRPWVFLITDGNPTDEWEEAAKRVHLQHGRGLSFFAVGTEDADMQVLQKISPRTPIKLRGLAFQELFLWLSASQKRVSASRVEDSQISLPPVDWASP